MTDKPNIVLIMADQMTYDVLGAVGHPVVRTPNIDKLAEQGVVFSNCYCNSPLCTPSRASFVTGKLVRDIGVFDNASELPATSPTFMHLLRCNGYHTVLSGKMHFIGPDQLHGFTERLTTDIYPSATQWTPDWTRGAYHNIGTGVRRLRKSGKCKWNMQLEYDEEVLYRTLEKIRKFETEEMSKPFFLCASFTHPHDPFEITPEYWEMYRDEKIPMPTVPAVPIKKMHPYDQWIQIHHERDIFELTEQQIIDNRRSYYGMVTYFDNLAGRIIEELKKMGLYDNTIIIVTSDHGEMLGEHGMWFKRTYFENSIRVPLVIKLPCKELEGLRIDCTVSLVDLAATILDIAGKEDYKTWIDDMEGDSFFPLLRNGETNEWKDEAVFEYYGEGPICSLVGVRKGVYKYVYVNGYEPLLFDLKSDPHETINLAGNPQYCNICCELHEKATLGWNGNEMDKCVIRSQKTRNMLNDSFKKSEQHCSGWDFQPFFDASAQYRRD